MPPVCRPGSRLSARPMRGGAVAACAHGGAAARRGTGRAGAASLARCRDEREPRSASAALPLCCPASGAGAGGRSDFSGTDSKRCRRAACVRLPPPLTLLSRPLPPLIKTAARCSLLAALLCNCPALRRLARSLRCSSRLLHQPAPASRLLLRARLSVSSCPAARGASSPTPGPVARRCLAVLAVRSQRKPRTPRTSRPCPQLPRRPRRRRAPLLLPLLPPPLEPA